MLYTDLLVFLLEVVQNLVVFLGGSCKVEEPLLVSFPVSDNIRIVDENVFDGFVIPLITFADTEYDRIIKYDEF